MGKNLEIRKKWTWYKGFKRKVANLEAIERSNIQRIGIPEGKKWKQETEQILMIQKSLSDIRKGWNYTWKGHTTFLRILTQNGQFFPTIKHQGLTVGKYWKLYILKILWVSTDSSWLLKDRKLNHCQLFYCNTCATRNWIPYLRCSRK